MRRLIVEAKYGVRKSLSRWFGTCYRGLGAGINATRLYTIKYRSRSDGSALGGGGADAYAYPYCGAV